MSVPARRGPVDLGAHPAIMRIQRFFLPALLVLGLAVAMDQGSRIAAEEEGSVQLGDRSARYTFPTRGALDFDILQRTCALFVGVRSGALESPAVFGNQPGDDEVHWNKCPGGAMVACRFVSTESGDTVRTGILLPR